MPSGNYEWSLKKFAKYLLKQNTNLKFKLDFFSIRNIFCKFSKIRQIFFFRTNWAKFQGICRTFFSLHHPFIHNYALLTFSLCHVLFFFCSLVLSYFCSFVLFHLCWIFFNLKFSFICFLKYAKCSFYKLILTEFSAICGTFLNPK